MNVYYNYALCYREVLWHGNSGLRAVFHLINFQASTVVFSST